MDNERCLAACRELARRLGIRIRYIGTGGSGLCILRGERLFFLNRGESSHDQLRAFVRDFKTLDLTGYFIVPALRELMGIDDDGDWDTD